MDGWHLMCSRLAGSLASVGCGLWCGWIVGVSWVHWRQFAMVGQCSSWVGHWLQYGVCVGRFVGRSVCSWWWLRWVSWWWVWLLLVGLVGVGFVYYYYFFVVVGCGGGDGGGDCGCGCLWLWWLCVMDILFYCSRYLILLWCLYYFIILKIKINPP